MSISYARTLRKNPTKAEYLLWYHLNRRQLRGLRFRRQQKIGHYIVDFVCYKKKLIIELDGGQHAVKSSYDQGRTRWLESQGFKIVRFWNNDVLGNLEAVWMTILRESV